jgi:hypothetical protein
MFLRPAFWFGVGAVVAYEFLPQITRALRPVIISTLTAGLAIADQMKVSGAGTKETFEDLVAEARMRHEAGKKSAATQASKASTAQRSKKSAKA